MKLAFKRALVLAPHTDDGEFGCGATIARLLNEGCKVKYLAFSDCQESIPKELPLDTLQKEMKLGTHALGIASDDVELLDYKVRYFPRDRQSILEDLVKYNRTFQPDLVLTPCRQDIHQDHSTITNEAIRAFKRTTILGYELPWNNLELPSDTIININQEYLNVKISAISAYESQKGRVYSSKEYVTALALTRGTRVGFIYGEAFECIRWIIK